MTKISITNGHIEEDGKYVGRIESFERAESLAARLTTQEGKTYLPVDRGEWVWPRYTVIEAPVLGEFCSMGFNGDYYPQGKIVKISKDYRIITLDNGKRFWRRKLSESWKYDKMWGLVPGNRDERNPSF